MASPATTGERRIALAAVAGAHGIKGEVRLKLFAEGLDSLAAGRSFFIGDRRLELAAIKVAGKAPIARFEGVPDRSAAEALRGSLVEVERSALPALEEGEYYLADLIGLPCVDEAGIPVGPVAAVENYGAGDLLEIELEGGKRSLIPFREPISVLEDGVIRIDRDFLA